MLLIIITGVIFGAVKFSPRRSLETDLETLRPIEEIPEPVEKTVVEQLEPSRVEADSNTHTEYEFTAFPTSEEYIGSITPLGWLGASTRSKPDLAHPLANERHHIFFNEKFSKGIEIYAPGSGSIEWASISPSLEWGFTIIVNDTHSYYLDHIGYLNSTLKKQIMQIQDFSKEGQINAYINGKVKVSAGQVIGYTNTTKFFDWGIVDESKINGISNRGHYVWKRHLYGVSAYDLSSESLKTILKSYYGIWHDETDQLIPQIEGPIGGSVRNDINGTLQGIWFFDHNYDDTWGQKIALFSPYCLNHSNFQIRLSIPELSIYGNWQNLALNSKGELNLKPYLVSNTTGIVGYLVDSSLGVGEEGLILVQMIDDFHVRIETFHGVYTMPETPEFTDDSVILYR